MKGALAHREKRSRTKAIILNEQKHKFVMKLGKFEPLTNFVWVLNA